MHAQIADKRPRPGPQISQPLAVRSAKVLSLLVILEALRQEPVPQVSQKV